MGTATTAGTASMDNAVRADVGCSDVGEDEPAKTLKVIVVVSEGWNGSNCMLCSRTLTVHVPTMSGV